MMTGRKRLPRRYATWRTGGFSAVRKWSASRRPIKHPLMPWLLWALIGVLLISRSISNVIG